MSPTRTRPAPAASSAALPAAPAPGAAATAAKALNAHLQYVLKPGAQRGAQIDNPLFDLLQAVHEAGSISHAARALGCSYRYAWGTLKDWEQTLGEALITWTQGQPARLTPFAERLLWAERRARTRIQPQLEALRAELDRMLAEARDDQQLLLTLYASHDVALSVLQQHAAGTAQLHLDLRVQGSVDSLRALNAGQCVVAGFHVPAERDADSAYARAMKPLLQPGLHKVIGFCRRRQGLMLRPELARRVFGLADVQRLGLRLVNRQVGSGTRLLMDHLVAREGLDPARLAGYHDHIEQTHVAVAASVAGGLADAGLGIEAAALEFGLHFLPLASEDYFLACLKPSLQTPAVQRLCQVLGSAGWQQLVAALPGYELGAAPGRVLSMTTALPWWQYGEDTVTTGAAGVGP
jgi:putative molybdopterin biosynthesis protein